jgi:xylulokinase
LNVLKERGIKAKNIKMVGGGAKSKIWPNIIADITGLNVLIPENHEEDFATKGAAIIAGYGSGIFTSLYEGYDKFKSNFKEIKPDQDNIKFYEEKFRLFEK